MTTLLGDGGDNVWRVSAGTRAIAVLLSDWVATRASGNAGAATLLAAGFSPDLTLASGPNGWLVTNEGIAAPVGLTGSAATDTLIGGTGDDALLGRGGNDLLTGDAGADTFQIDLGSDTITDFGFGADRLQVLAGGVVTATVVADWTATSGNGNYGSATLLDAGHDIDLSAVVIGPNGWTVSNAGSAVGVRLAGSAMADTLIGGAGDDVFIGGPGGDILQGGAGHNSLIYSVGFRGSAEVINPDGSCSLTTAFGTDTLANIAVVTFVDGRLVFDAADPVAQVTRLYQAALHRLPDQGGLNDWTAALAQGGTLQSLAAAFVSAPEFIALYGAGLDDPGFVTALYQNALGRAPDPGGLATWVGALGHGWSRADALVAFSECPENLAQTRGLVAAGIWDLDELAAQVARLYDTVLHRAPDLAGLVGWKGLLASGQLSMAQAAEAFAGSAEFQSIYGALDNAGFVTALYENALRRAPDADGLATWVYVLEAGVLTRSGVVLGFSESAEHIWNTVATIQAESPGPLGILFA
jgi:hypothetical protein